MRQIEYCDFIQIPFTQDCENLHLVNIRGCNGSGKSTIPIKMMESDFSSFEVIVRDGNKPRVLCTVFPKYGFLALGHYHSKCGGMDSIKTTDDIKHYLNLVMMTNFHIIMEGIMASTVYQTYADLFKYASNYRKVTILNILPTLSVCLHRIQMRNGGKPIKEEQVESKWNTVKRNHDKFSKDFDSIVTSNEDVDIENTLQWFFSMLPNTDINIFEYNRGVYDE